MVTEIVDGKEIGTYFLRKGGWLIESIYCSQKGAKQEFEFDFGSFWLLWQPFPTLEEARQVLRAEYQKFAARKAGAIA